MKDKVIVIRTHQGDDILGTLIDEDNATYGVYNPYYVRYSSTVGISLVPYCYLTDEKYYKFDKTKVEFMVEASERIADKFLYVSEMEEDMIESPFVNLVKGNETKH